MEGLKDHVLKTFTVVIFYLIQSVLFSADLYAAAAGRYERSHLIDLVAKVVREGFISSEKGKAALKAIETLPESGTMNNQVFDLLDSEVSQTRSVTNFRQLQVGASKQEVMFVLNSFGVESVGLKNRENINLTEPEDLTPARLAGYDRLMFIVSPRNRAALQEIGFLGADVTFKNGEIEDIQIAPTSADLLRQLYGIEPAKNIRADYESAKTLAQLISISKELMKKGYIRVRSMDPRANTRIIEPITAKDRRLLARYDVWSGFVRSAVPGVGGARLLLRFTDDHLDSITIRYSPIV